MYKMLPLAMNYDFSLYFDYAATTPLLPAVAEKIASFNKQAMFFVNPSANYSHAHALRSTINCWEEDILSQLDSRHGQLIWTSGATESINTALRGIASSYKHQARRILSIATEHSATLATLEMLKNQGFSIEMLPVDSTGCLNPQTLAHAIDDNCLLFTISHINNEIGTIQPVAELAKICHDHGVFCHLDAAQSLGKIPINVTELGYDLISFSAHKCYGPKGIGALYIHQPQRLGIQPLLYGGNQQQGYRSGTLPLALIAGMYAAWLEVPQLLHDYKRLESLRLQLHELLKHGVDPICPHTACPHIRMYSLPPIKKQALERLRDRYCLAQGAACSHKRSHVLNALNIPQDREVIRVALGYWSSDAAIRLLASDITAALV